MRQLNYSRIDEPQVRDNFKTLDSELAGNPVFNGEWKLFDREFTSTGTFTVYHRLGFKPLDMITTYNTATFTADLPNADASAIDLTVTAIGRIRFVLGRMK